MLIKNARIFDGLRYFDGDCIEIRSDVFSRIFCGCSDSGTIDAQGRILIPGLIDAHMHGVCGHDCMQPGGIEKIARALPTFGTTAFYPTSPCEEDELMLTFLNEIQAAMKLKHGAQIMGAHLKGPCLVADAIGTHVEYMLQDPSTDYFDDVLKAYGQAVARVSIAPEMPGALEVIQKLTSYGIIVSIGHTHADGDIIRRAVRSGASLVTHMFNGMTPMHHRDPGAVGASLTCDDLFCEFIADMIHVHPTCIEVLLRCKGNERAMAVTDGISASGNMPDGVYPMGTQEIEVEDGRAMWEGKLAGSTLTMDKALKNLVDVAGVPLEVAIALCSTNPAKVMRIDNRKGRIAPGMDADAVLLNPDLSVHMTIVRGNIEYACI